VDELILSTVRLSIPLLLAALGGLLSERAGVANVGLEGFLLIGAFTAATVSALGVSPALAVVVAVMLSAAAGGCFRLILQAGRADHIVIGMALNLLVAGSLPLVTKSLFGQTGATPSLGPEETLGSVFGFFIGALVILAGVVVFFRQTKWGLFLHTAGQSPSVLTSLGVSVNRVRFWALCASGALCGLGGAYLSVGFGSGYSRDMAAGRGYLALAALIFGAWRPIPTVVGVLVFAFLDATQIRLQGTSIGGWTPPSQFLQTLPFALTLVLLAVWGQRATAPAAINQEPARF
jgi:simple sugar transport system permease protein